MLLARGRADAALRGLEAALQPRSWVGGQRRGLLLAHLAIVAAQAGDGERARRAMSALEAQPAYRERDGLRPLLAQARAELAWLERNGSEAEAWLREACVLWRQVEAPLELARTRLRLGEILLAGDDHDAAELELAAAEAAFRQIGAQAPADACAALRAASQPR